MSNEAEIQEIKETKEQMRRKAQAVVEWLDEECSVLPLVSKIQGVTGIPASL